MKQNQLKVKKWLCTGELKGSPRTQRTILEQCGNLLDHACSYEILGLVMFQATDGKYYSVNVEAIIEEASPDLVKQVLEEE
jgi:hypothetical protein